MEAQTMGISHRVSATLDAIEHGNFDQALHDICSAIEQTSRRESGASGAGTYKDFVRENFALITRTSFGTNGTIGRLRVAYSHPEIKPEADGLVGFEAVLYHAVRCGLYHSTELPSNLRFAPGRVIRCDGGKSLVLPAELVTGLVMAVVASPANAAESIDDRYRLQIDFVQLVVNHAWGKRNQLNALFESMIALSTAMVPFQRR